ncbi:hypothetical protein AKO1_001317 [Acrasis kona]|uniref:Uncharacterized protein n=1 Tax=Acrasis kona TaxID=1008807 RepID=A0AAW2ZAZ2_9EUKA
MPHLTPSVQHKEQISPSVELIMNVRSKVQDIATLTNMSLTNLSLASAPTPTRTIADMRNKLNNSLLNASLNNSYMNTDHRTEHDMEFTNVNQQESMLEESMVEEEHITSQEFMAMAGVRFAENISYRRSMGNVLAYTSKPPVTPIDVMEVACIINSELTAIDDLIKESQTRFEDLKSELVEKEQALNENNPALYKRLSKLSREQEQSDVTHTLTQTGSDLSQLTLGIMNVRSMCRFMSKLTYYQQRLSCEKNVNFSILNHLNQISIQDQHVINKYSLSLDDRIHEIEKHIKTKKLKQEQLIKKQNLIKQEQERKRMEEASRNDTLKKSLYFELVHMAHLYRHFERFDSDLIIIHYHGTNQGSDKNIAKITIRVESDSTQVVSTLLERCIDTEYAHKLWNKDESDSLGYLKRTLLDSWFGESEHLLSNVRSIGDVKKVLHFCDVAICRSFELTKEIEQLTCLHNKNQGVTFLAKPIVDSKVIPVRFKFSDLVRRTAFSIVLNLSTRYPYDLKDCSFLHDFKNLNSQASLEDVTNIVNRYPSGRVKRLTSVCGDLCTLSVI